LKSKSLLSILAVVAAALMPLAAASQIAPERQKRAETAEPTYKWNVFAGYGYTSLNQVNGSRHGLQGVNLSVTRDWGKYFGITADGAFYPAAVASGNPCPTSASCNPTVDAVLFGPEFHGNVYERLDVFVHVLLGGEHTGGEQQTPSISFAAGAGGGMDYKLSQRFALRASGDDIASSFSFIGNTPALKYSPHMRRNSRAAFGLVYRF
jgi:opacity protein-like surface antigen